MTTAQARAGAIVSTVVDNPHVEHKTDTMIDFAVTGKDKRRKKILVLNRMAGEAMIHRNHSQHLRVVKRLRTVTTITITTIEEWRDVDEEAHS